MSLKVFIFLSDLLIIMLYFNINANIIYLGLAQTDSTDSTQLDLDIAKS